MAPAMVAERSSMGSDEEDDALALLVLLDESKVSKDDAAVDDGDGRTALALLELSAVLELASDRLNEDDPLEALLANDDELKEDEDPATLLSELALELNPEGPRGALDADEALELAPEELGRALDAEVALAGAEES